MLFEKRSLPLITATFCLLLGCSGEGSDEALVGESNSFLPKITNAATTLPQIRKINPLVGNAGTSVTLTGRFDDILSVRFGGIEASSFSVSVDEKTLTAVAPENVDTATIVVENSLGTAESAQVFESWCNPIIKKENTLVINDLSVVNDAQRTAFVSATPNSGVWSFSFLMDKMRPRNTPFTQFMQSWFDEWKNVTTINGFPVVQRSTIDTIVNSWPRLADNSFDMEKSPFRLLAITSRIDLRAANDAGEGRFVFGVVDSAGLPLQFTVILEYRLPFENGETMATWVEQWHELSQLALPSEKFNKRLEALTKKFSTRRFSSSFVNGNAIGQVRTNEIALDTPWELREFRLDSATGLLKQVTTAQTPDASFNKSTTLDQFMLSNIDSIRNGTYVVPGTMLAGATQAVLTTRWKNLDNSVPSDVRASFSLGTCNACHSGETATEFTHIKPREALASSILSDFLIGDEDRRVTDLTNVIIENLCTSSAGAQSSTLALSSENVGTTWVSQVDSSRDVNESGERVVDFTSAREILSQRGVKVLGVAKNFRKAKGFKNQEVLQCLLVHQSNVEKASAAGFERDADCAQNPYKRVH